MKSVCFVNNHKAKVDLYDALRHDYLIRDVGDEGCFEIQAKSSRLVVVLPAGSKIQLEDGNYKIGSSIVAFSQKRIK
jgi:hypothetical protein